MLPLTRRYWLGRLSEAVKRQTLFQRPIWVQGCNVN